MNDLTKQWVDKAEMDFQAGLQLMQVVSPPLPEIACFHAQQCIEKYAKAFLQEKGVDFERTHNMVYLNARCMGVDSDFKNYQARFMELDEYSVGVRYPGGSVSETDAREALIAMTELRMFIRLKLGLEFTE